MLVAVALLVLMMTVIVQVFAAATGAVSAQRTYQELDTTLRQLDSTIRTDLTNLTARLTPPLDPDFNLGYFEYGENSFADLQGEDSDDYVRFTVKAPEGQLFYGRMYAPPGGGLTMLNMTAYQVTNYIKSQPITITSQYAEVIYFLRNGNLYRRVLLIAPDRQDAVTTALTNAAGVGAGTPLFRTGVFGGGTIPVSWQGVNDLSAHPTPTGVFGSTVILNTLGDLTNRENRFAYSRFANDFYTYAQGTATAATAVPDGTPDDLNNDTVPDFWPSLYFGAATYKNPVTNLLLVNEVQWWPGGNPRTDPTITLDCMTFPYLYEGGYSVAEPKALGPIHTPDPSVDPTLLADLRRLNHNPLDIGSGDSLPYPPAGSLGGTGRQTWWGFPTWRETMDANWLDPFRAVNDATLGYGQFPAFSLLFTKLPPPMTGNIPTGWTVPLRLTPQLFNDGAGNPDYAADAAGGDSLWKQCWEDDLIATGVRSFDIKAYDNSFPGYVDLGWGDDLRQYAAPPAAPPFLVDNSTAVNPNTATGFPLLMNWPRNSTSFFPLIGQTYAHEGRIPPMPLDYRLDATATNEQSASADSSFNIGDATVGIGRIRRVWDSWSTDYSSAPSTGVNSNSGNPATFGMPVGPPFSRPVYPSYPPPYPMPLRGIQIQIRVVDPRNERIKVLTIRQDFSDRL
jgi:hypothetical protein